MIDWKRYEDELAAARTAVIAAEIVATRRSRRLQALLLGVGTVGIVVLTVRAVRAPTRQRVYQIAATVCVPLSTAPMSVHRS